MSTLPLSIVRNLRLIGGMAVAISLATWTMEWSGVVEVCPYCQVERTVIGLLGLLLLLPVRGWWVRYTASVVAALGAVTAATQHFNGWKAIQKGEFHGFSPIYANGFVLSAVALAIIVGLWSIIADLNAPDPGRP